jgi:hypothetical protein
MVADGGGWWWMVVGCLAGSLAPSFPKFYSYLCTEKNRKKRRPDYSKNREFEMYKFPQ